MDSSFLLTSVAAAIGFFTLFRRFRIHQENKDVGSSSPSPPPSLSCNWTHHVFPSFRGEDVRRNFLSHIQKEFRRKGITPFIDNEIRRGESIGPELIKAIRGSKIAIVLLSRNYASSKWCLGELVEIMKCKKELGQTVFAIFYEVDPSHVKKLTGEFGAVFEKTCKGKTKEDIWRWRQAFKEVATIAGYDSSNWENEAVMIEEIVTEISKRLINSTPSSGFEGLIGMGAHMDKMKRLLCLDSDERRTIGIWGPSGIGKTTIARVVHNQISDGFQLSVFMSFKPSYARPTYSDDHDVKLHLEHQFLSQLLNQEDIKIPHLGAAQNLLMDKKMLVVLDGVDQLVQLLAMPKAVCLGPGSRVIITTQDQKLLNVFKIKLIYNVDFPSLDEALQIFCKNAFGQDSPYDGFEKLAREVTKLAGSLPLGLRVMGSHLRGMSKQEWKAELPRLRIRLDGEIGSILKFSYDALDDDDKDLFLHIACFFNDEGIYEIFEEIFEDTVRHRFAEVQQGIWVLLQRSLISRETFPQMHCLLVQLGREIVRNQSIYEPGKRQFLVDAKEICEVLTDNTGSKSVIGITLDFSEIEEDTDLSERAFEEMSNLQFIRFHRGYGISCNRLCLPQGLNYLPQKLRILRWDHYPVTCLPSKFDTKFLVKICMKYSKLEKLWEGIQPLMNLKLMDLSYSTNLKEFPDLSTAINLLELGLFKCESLVELDSCIGNATNLQKLNLRKCSSLVELPSSIGNATNLQYLNLSDCSSLVELPSSIGNLSYLYELDLNHCSSLVELPSSIGNLSYLPILDLSHCSSLVELPSSIGDLIKLHKLDLRHCSGLVELPSSIENLINLKELDLRECLNLVELTSSIENLTNIKNLKLSGCSNLVEPLSFIGNLTNLNELDLHECSSLMELPSSIGNLINLQRLDLRECSGLVELPNSIGNLTNLQNLSLNHCSNLVELLSSIGNLTCLRELDLSECSSLVELPSSIGNATNLQKLNLRGCSSLVKLPSSIENAINLQEMYLSGCSNLLDIPSSIGNLRMLTILGLQGCTKLEFLPININLDSLKELDVTGCSQLIGFPEIATNVERLMLCGTLIKQVPSSIKSWSRLHDFRITYCEALEELPHILDIITELELNNTEIEDVPPWVNGITRLRRLVLNKCRKLVSLPQLPAPISSLDTEYFVSVERIVCSFPNPQFYLNIANRWKLNESVRNFINQQWMSRYAVLPGRQVPAFFTNRATNGGSLTVKLKKRRLHTSLRFKACILLVTKGDKGPADEILLSVSSTFIDKHSGLKTDPCVLTYRHIHPLFPDHLYIFESETGDVELSEIILEFEVKSDKVESDKWEIGECGIREILEEDPHVDSFIIM